MLLLCASALYGGAVQAAPISFQDVSETVGFGGQTESWGLSWGDINADNWPDLFVQGHRDYPRLYRNSGNGVFDDVAYEYDPEGLWISKPWQDKHGAAFGDFDNDGDEDILMAATTDDGQLLVNEHTTGGKFIERAAQAGLADDARARHVNWFDYTGDGYLDVTQLSHTGQFLRRQEPSQGLKFADELNTSFNCPNRIHYGQLIDLNNDDIMELICSAEGAFPQRVFDISSLPFSNITANFPTTGLVLDQVVGDYNNDLLQDVVLVRGLLRPSGASQVSATRAEGWFRKAVAVAKGFRFAATGPVEVTVDYSGMPYFGDPAKVQLDSTGQTSGTAGPVNVSLDSGSGLWEIDWPAGATGQIYVQVEASNGLSNVTAYGFESVEQPVAPYHAVSNGSSMNFAFNTGLNSPMPCVSGVAADFDNDMDQDLYLVCRNGIDNLANRYFDNQGDGTFVEVQSHGGEGPVGAGLTLGVADSVATADYDVDGFMDLAVVNGLLYYPVSRGGDDILLRNQGNANNWVELDLVGTTSNRDGVGAKVIATTGGVSQLREQNNGIHRWSQNHQRIHFGLASNPTVDITVKWPSGQVDSFTNVAANQLYDVTEGNATNPATITPAVLGQPIETALIAGEECGEPPYNEEYGPVMLAWRDCPSNIWNLRLHGGGVTQATQTTQGSITADANFNSVTGIALENTDTLNNSPSNVISFSIDVWYNNAKGISLDTAGQNSACLELDTQEIPTLIVGAVRKKLSQPLDLVTLATCNDQPSFNISSLNTSESAGAATFDVSLTAPASQIVEVSYTTSPDTAGPTQDYISTSDTLTFPVGTTSLPVAITLVDDASYETAETFSVSLSNPIGAPLGGASVGTATINDDDPIPTISIANTSANESNPTANITVSLSNPSSQDIMVDYSTVDGSANAGEDYSSQNGNLTFSAGTLSEVIQVPVLEDVVDELDENFTLLLSNAQNADLAAGTSANVVIVRDPLDTIPSVAITSTSDVEDNANGNLTFTVSLSAPNSNNISVDYSTSDSTAIAPDDYVAVADTLTFSPNQTSQSIVVALVDDSEVETTEAFNLSLTNPVNATLSANNSATGTIVDNDTLPNIAITSASDTEDNPNGTLTFTVSLAEPSPNSISVDYSTSDGTAIAPNDYVAVADTLTFAPNETSQNILVALVDDSEMETSEEFNLTLSNPVNATLSASNSAVGTILDNDTLSPSDACDQPVYDAATEVGLFVWRDCSYPGPEQRWNLTITGGGTAFSVFTGELESSTELLATPVQLEANDVLDSVSGDMRVDFTLGAGGAGEDGFQVDVPSGTTTCFDASALPSGVVVNLGGNRIPMTTSFSLDTLQACSTLPPSASCGTPSFDAGSDLGVFAWQNCGFSGAGDEWEFRITGGGTVFSTYQGALSSSVELTATGVSLENSDALDTVAGDNTVDYVLRAGGSGIDGFRVNIPQGTDTCFDPNLLPAGATVKVGANNTLVNGAFALDTLGSCSGPTGPECGEPTLDNATDAGIYLWKECTVNNRWQVRVPGGSAPWAERAGTLTATQTLAPTGVSLENTDRLDTTPGDGFVNFNLFVGGTGVDGFEVDIPNGAQTCFDLGTVPAGTQVFFGPSKVAVPTPFNLENLGVCL